MWGSNSFGQLGLECSPSIVSTPQVLDKKVGTLVSGVAYCVTGSSCVSGIWRRACHQCVSWIEAFLSGYR